MKAARLYEYEEHMNVNLKVESVLYMCRER